MAWLARLHGRHVCHAAALTTTSLFSSASLSSRSFLIDSSFFNLVDPATGNRISTPGDYDLTAFNGVDVSAQASVTLTGDEVIIEKFPTL